MIMKKNLKKRRESWTVLFSFQFCSLCRCYCPFSKPDKDFKSAPMCFYQA